MQMWRRARPLTCDGPDHLPAFDTLPFGKTRCVPIKVPVFVYPLPILRSYSRGHSAVVVARQQLLDRTGGRRDHGRARSPRDVNRIVQLLTVGACASEGID